MQELDLNRMKVDIEVVDRNRVRKDKFLGKICIGPKDKHWKKMLKWHGTSVKMSHTLGHV